jgi:uncharacterized protein with PQ loop repeat
MIKSIFYLIQKIVTISKKDDLDSAILSIIIFSSFLGVNVLSIWGILYKLKIFNSFFNSAVPIIIIFGILIILNLILFIKDKRYLKIKNEMDNLQPKQKKKMIVKGTIYFIVSFILFSIALALK